MKIQTLTSALLATAILWSGATAAVTLAQGLIGAPCEVRYGQSYEAPVELYPEAQPIAIVVIVIAFMAIHFMPLPKKRGAFLVRFCLETVTVILVPAIVQVTIQWVQWVQWVHGCVTPLAGGL